MKKIKIKKTVAAEGPTTTSGGNERTHGELGQQSIENALPVSTLDSLLFFPLFCIPFLLSRLFLLC